MYDLRLKIPTAVGLKFDNNNVMMMMMHEKHITCKKSS